MNIRSLLLGGFTGSLLAFVAGQAVAADPPPAAPPPSAETQPPPWQPQLTMPEIRILADHDTEHLSSMQKDILKAEQKFYDTYNNANDNRLYDIHCNWEQPTSTHFKFFVCRPVFQEEQQRDISLGLLPAKSGDASLNQATDVKTSVIYRDFQQHMIDVVGKNPELIHLLLERSALMKKYDEVQKKKHENGKIFVWD